MFNVGDLVKVIDEEVEGRVIDISSNKVTIENQFGFDESYHKSQLILKQNLEVNSVPLKEPKIETTKVSSIKKIKLVKEIDLHFGHLVDFPRGIKNHEMLQIQLNTVKKEIDLARQEKRKKIIFIHGHGKGVLKSELHKLLKTYSKLEYYDASFKKYKLGATEVVLF